ncbi:MAG: ATP-binding protein, partial [Acidimicrobiia bacterium]
VLKPTPNSVPRARRFVLGLDWAEGASDERLAIVTTEIVTNAILHARTGFRVSATELPGGIRVEVTDRSTDPPVMKSYGPESPTGRGLHIVDAMADRWGVDPTKSGKTVWFEVDNQMGSA